MRMERLPLVLRPLQIDDLPALTRHRERHSLENGKDGDVVFYPFEVTTPTEPTALEAQSAREIDTHMTLRLR